MFNLPIPHISWNMNHIRYVLGFFQVVIEDAVMQTGNRRSIHIINWCNVNYMVYSVRLPEMILIIRSVNIFLLSMIPPKTAKSHSTLMGVILLHQNSVINSSKSKSWDIRCTFIKLQILTKCLSSIVINENKPHGKELVYTVIVAH